MSKAIAEVDTGMEVVIHTNAGDLKLTPAIVRKYLVNGNGNVTDQEIALFLGLCRAQNLNPFTREAFLVKYSGNQPAAIIVAKDAFLKRAYRSESFKGHKAGVICQASGQGNITYTEGFCPPESKIVGGWAEVHREGWAFPLRVEVDLNEYQAKKSDGTPNRMWSEKPATMVRKVALVQALREAFPDNFGGMYSEEEIPTQDELPRSPVSDQSVIDVSGGSDMRRRRNKFRVDPMIFGSDEIMTCGCTDKQLMELHAAAKSDPDSKLWITAQVKLLTGHDQWSYMREDEAAQLLEAVEIYRQRKTVNEDPPTESSEPPPAAVSSDPQALPDDLVDCPNGDRVSVSLYCSQCRDRQAQGWCHVVDEKPEEEETKI
jgi:phage recombination protein Bet